MKRRELGSWEKRVYGFVILLVSIALATLCVYVASTNLQAGAVGFGSLFTAAGLFAVLLAIFGFRLMASSSDERDLLSPAMLTALSTIALIGTSIGWMLAAASGAFLAALPSGVVVTTICVSALALARRRARNAA